jgi:rod shape-determining protein MreC
MSIRNPHPLQSVESLVIGLTAPVLKKFTALGEGVVRVWRGYLYLIGAQQENEVLKKKLEEYVQKEIQYQEALLTKERLERLLDLKTQMAVPITGARVIGYEPSVWFKCAIIDKGEADGVRWGMPVLNTAGIVGRVIESYLYYSKVMLLLDRNSAIDAYIQRNRLRGILEGKGGTRCHLRYILKNNDVQLDDVIMASGLGGIYPRGMALGRVVSVDKKAQGIFQEIEVVPLVEFANLEEVVVVKVITPPFKK